LGEAEELLRCKDPDNPKVKKIRILMDGYLDNFKNIANENYEKAMKIMEECNEMLNKIETGEAKNYREEQVEKRRKDMQQFMEELEN
jgi:hypothetical protein